MTREPLPDRERSARAWTAVYLAAAGAMLAVAAWWRFSLPLSPGANSDLYTSLNPALAALAGGGFHQASQPFLYPGLLYVILRAVPDLRAIVFLNHLLGLATGVLLLGAWRTAGRLVESRLVRGWLRDGSGLVMYGLWLFAPMPLQLEFAIRPESICPFFVAFSIFATAQFLERRKAGSSAGALAWAGAALFAAFLLPILKPSFWLSALLASLAAWPVFFEQRFKAVIRLAVAGISLGAIAALLLVARHFAREDFASSSFFPESIFSIHALMIREQIAADLAQPDPANRYQPADLESTLRLLDAGIQASRNASPLGFPTLGYDADYLMHRDPFFATMARHGRSQWALDFYRYYYARTWRKRPAEMAAKVVKQLGLFYNFQCPAFEPTRFRMKNLYRDNPAKWNDPVERAVLDRWPAAAHLSEAEADALARAPEVVPVPRAVAAALRALGMAYVPILLTSSCVLICVPFDRRRRARLGTLAALLAVCFAYNTGNNLGIAIFHTLEIGRYSSVQFAGALFFEFTAALFLAEWALEIFGKAADRTLPEFEQRPGFAD